MCSALPAAVHGGEPIALLDLEQALGRLREDVARSGRRVRGGAHPLTTVIEVALQNARTTLRAREAGKRVVFTTT